MIDVIVDHGLFRMHYGAPLASSAPTPSSTSALIPGQGR